MRITYLARHGPHGNADEDAITHALGLLGHEVRCYHERDWQEACKQPGDLFLFHKWFNEGALQRLQGRCIRAFWQFDWLSPGCDAKLAKAVESLLPLVDYGFATDGDWVANMRDTSPARLYWLPQGADIRVTGRYPPGARSRILFAGGRSIGPARVTWLNSMLNRWGRDFRIVERSHGPALGALVAGADIVVAPDAPGSDRYCSNRLYLMQGFGAFLIHPYYLGIAEHYEDGREIVYYRSRGELHRLIARYLDEPGKREEIAAAGFARTVRDHTYTDRVERMLRYIQGF